MNSSFPPLGPRVRNSLITTVEETASVFCGVLEDAKNSNDSAHNVTTLRDILKPAYGLELIPDAAQIGRILLTKNTLSDSELA